MIDPIFDVAVLGGGPAGMMAAATAAAAGSRVVLLEKNPILGKKLLITGGGRCNILHAEFDVHALVAKYGKKGKSLFSAFSAFDAKSTWDFFESRGLRLKIEAEQRAFPISDKAEDVHRTMLRSLKESKVEVRTGIEVQSIESSGVLITKIVHSLGSIKAKKFILATGGKSHPETGSTGDGFQWAKQLGHTVIEPEAALVPITIKDSWIADVAGISLKVAKLTVLQGARKHGSSTGKMLFTHTGLSGPLVLNASKKIGALLKIGPVTVSLDLFPKMDAGALDRYVTAVFDQCKNKMIKNNIGVLVQPRLGHVLLRLSGIDPSVFLHQLKRDERLSFVRLLKDVPMSVSGLLGEDKAIVTGGGVDVREVEFRTMRSKKIQNLYFAGDILDFDRPSGGFSLQICWTTGFVAGKYSAQDAEL